MASPPASAPLITHTRLLLVVTVLVVAANLRPAITALGPILDRVGDDAGLSATSLGLLGALPLLTFGLVSPVVHHLTARFGADVAVFGALVVLVAGTLVRSLPGLSAYLWIGTVLLAAAIAVGNVLVPAIVKRDFPDHVPLMTGLYSATLSGFAALASGIAVPIASAASWRMSLGVWAVLSVIAASVWSLRLRGQAQRRARNVDEVPAPGSSMWTSSVAWQVALFMAVQSMNFYLMITWLPSIEVEHGTSSSAAGWHLFLFQMSGIVSGLLAGRLLQRTPDQRAVGASFTSLMAVAALGLIFAPGLTVLWAGVSGFSAGATLVVALTLMSVRTRTPQSAARLSGMSQSVGYLIAALGPLAAGFVFDQTGSWVPVLAGVAGLACIQMTIVLFAGRNRFTHE